MVTYYNESDPYAAQWLRNLIEKGHIAPGDVDERDIREVCAADLLGYTQKHFFAGIGGWPLALRMAGWPDSRPVWTGSCPCQPFSDAAAGRREGFTDKRHLWPVWFGLIRVCRPAVVFGEQVGAAVGGGWLDLVCADLESQDYTCGSAVLPACGVGAPHIRQRLWFVADDTEPGRHSRRRAGEAGEGHDAARFEPGRLRAADAVVDAASEQAGLPGRARQSRGSAWSDLEWLPCTDGKTRPTQSGLFPLAHGIPGRVGRLRAYGNAVVPQLAAEFIDSYLAARRTLDADCLA